MNNDKLESIMAHGLVLIDNTLNELYKHLFQLRGGTDKFAEIKESLEKLEESANQLLKEVRGD